MILVYCINRLSFSLGKLVKFMNWRYELKCLRLIKFQIFFRRLNRSLWNKFPILFLVGHRFSHEAETLTMSPNFNNDGNIFQFKCGHFWIGFNCLRASEPLRGDSLLLTIKFSKYSGTHLTDLRRMKGWIDRGATFWFWTSDHWIGNTRL